MGRSFAASACDLDGFDRSTPIMPGLIEQYEKIIVQSIITSFGLDFIVKDQHGGDVDTVHNVRRIGEDGDMAYKSQANKDDYDNTELYNSDISRAYHSHENYIAVNRQASADKKAGNLTDAYTGEKFARNAKINLDHTIAAKEIHNDRGRILSGLNGEDLACSPENLNITSERTNKSKGAKTMAAFLDAKGSEYSEADKKRMLAADAKARAAYEHKLFVAYYTSPSFAKDTAMAAGRIGLAMGMRQALGLVFTEIWFAVKEKSALLPNGFELKAAFQTVVDGVKEGLKRAKGKFADILAKFKEGMVAGALSSITTTICNIFFTTAKNVVNIIRQCWASLVEALKILLFNPDNLPFGERMRAVCKVLAVGASVVMGKIAQEAIAKSPIGTIPEVGDIASVFVGTLCTGIMSCTLLYALDRSSLVNGIVELLNRFRTIDDFVVFFERQADAFEAYASELMKIDVGKFRSETQVYNAAVKSLSNAQSPQELNAILLETYRELDLGLPWEGDFNDFMADRSRKLVFC